MNDNIPIFTKKQIIEQTKEIADFLELIKPQLTENVYKEVATEIRPLKRDKSSKIYLPSFNTYRMDNNDKNQLYKYLSKVNGEGFCLYYSVFDFNKSEKSNNKINNKINNNNAVYTTILPIDLDNITTKQYVEVVDTLKSIGLETVDINTGHGYQMIILLNEKVYDKDILKKFTTTLLNKGIPCDEAIIDTARIMRLPYTFNCKCLDENSKYYGKEEPCFVEIIGTTYKRYSSKYVFEQLNKLDDVSSTYSNKIIDINKVITINKVIEPIKNIEPNNNFTTPTNIIEKYTDINFNNIPKALAKILCGTPEGLRNQALLFMLPVFKNNMGYDKDSIERIFTTWGELCTPIIDEDEIMSTVTRLYRYGYKKNFGTWTGSLAKEYGYFDFNTYKLNKANNINIPNKCMEKIKYLSSAAFKIYIAMMIEKANQEASNVQQLTIKDLATLTNYSEKTIRRNIKILIKLKFITKKKNAKRKNVCYHYYVNPYFSSIKGFTAINKDKITEMFEKVGNEATKLYTYILSMINNKKEDTCWASQEYLGEEVGLTQPCISKMTTKLHKNNFIEKITIFTYTITHCEYKILS